MPRPLFTLCCALLAAAGLYGQEPVPPEASEAVAKLFQRQPGERTLACAIVPLPPLLTFRLIYRAGYSVTVSMEQLMEESRSLEVLVRVTPKRSGAHSLLLKDTGTLPAEASEQGKAASKFEAQISGGFYLGEGEYRVELVVAGSGQKIARKQWDVEVKPQKGVKSALAPGDVAGHSQVDLPRLGARAGSLTIFLHAGAARGNSVLLQSIAALLDRMPFRRVQVVTFSLDQHKELARQNVTDTADFGRVAEALKGHNTATVSYGVLRDPAGHRDFLWKLLAKEELRVPPDDLVVFVGYSTFDDSHVFVPPACADGSQKTAYVYLDYALPGRARFHRRMRGIPGFGEPRPGPWTDLPEAAALQPVMPDAISRVTRACSGKVFPIYSPANLASALQKTDELLSGR